MFMMFGFNRVSISSILNAKYTWFTFGYCKILDESPMKKGFRKDVDFFLFEGRKDVDFYSQAIGRSRKIYILTD